PLPEAHEPQVAFGLRLRDRGRKSVERRVKHEVVPGRLTLVEAGLLGEDPDGGADLRVIAAQLESRDLRGARSWRDERAEEPQGRRLAGAVRSQEAEDLAFMHLEINAVDGGEGAEPLGQFLGADDAPHVIRSLFLEFTDDRV